MVMAYFWPSAHTPNLDYPIQYKKKAYRLWLYQSRFIYYATEGEGIIGVEFF